MSTTTYLPTRDHMVVTKGKRRNDTIHSAVVVSLQDVSPTTKAFDLQVGKTADGEGFFFSPGQWLDVFIPGLEVIGGFSLTSTPKQLVLTGRVSLAVKYSTWPPAHWFHTECTVGSELNIRCGGDFVLPENPNGDLVFLAGGVGINPIASMIFHLMEINYEHSITLLYTAKTEQELLFKARFDELQLRYPKFCAHYFVTEETSGANEPAGVQSGFQKRRIVGADFKNHSDSSVILFVCGPPSLIDLAKSQSNMYHQIKFEEWWTSA
ncbi:unnamed protein product [Allacma fusca]|nr:unnamed protein product [Allacma fusca]